MKTSMFVATGAAALCLAAGFGLAGSAATIEIPNTFRGQWIDAAANPMKVTVAADGILFGSSPPACKFTNVKVANEDEAGLMK